MAATTSLPIALVRSLRPHQWVKNVVVFGGLAFTARWHRASSAGDVQALLSWVDIIHAVSAFAVFCLISSAGYLVNDLHDIEEDRLHPRKRHRPIASGAVPLRLAWAMAAACFVLGILGSAALSYRAEGGTRYFLVTVLAYAALTNLYSFELKRFVIVDVLTIGILFVLRAIGGCYVIPEPPSPWIIVCTMFGALFIALCKRRGELAAQAGSTETRSVLAKYASTDGPPTWLLDQMIQMAGTATILCYSIYTFVRPRELLAGPVQAGHEQFGLMFTIPFVVYGVFRYTYLVHKRDIGQNPELLFRDRAMLLNLAAWSVVAVFVTRGRA